MKRMLISAIFLVAFISTCALLGRYLPFPDVPDVRAKIEHLARHGDEYDVLFIGSSRVHQQILPTIFDRIAGMNGFPVKSFNAGLTGMMSPEDGYMIEEVLRRPHRRLRWVFVEMTSFAANFGGEQNWRFTYWHDTVRLGIVVRVLYGQAVGRLAKDPEAGFSAKYRIWTTIGGRLWVHVHAWLIRAANVNRGGEILNRWLHGPGWYFNPRDSLGDSGDGWIPAELSYQKMAPDARAKYEQAYAGQLAQPAGKVRDNAASQAVIERSLAAVTKAGARPVIIVPPMISGRNFYPTEEREREVTILDFSDVRQYPELFVPEHRTDVFHLNTVGAEIFSDILARRFVEIVKGRAPMP